MRCPNCEAQVPDGERFCPHCGVPIEGVELEPRLSLEGERQGRVRPST